MVSSAPGPLSSPALPMFIVSASHSARAPVYMSTDAFCTHLPCRIALRFFIGAGALHERGAHGGTPRHQMREGGGRTLAA